MYGFWWFTEVLQINSNYGCHKERQIIFLKKPFVLGNEQVHILALHTNRFC